MRRLKIRLRIRLCLRLRTRRSLWLKLRLRVRLWLRLKLRLKLRFKLRLKLRLRLRFRLGLGESTPIKRETPRNSYKCRKKNENEKNDKNQIGAFRSQKIPKKTAEK